MVEDHVDQTNGCYCEGIPEDKRPRHAHPRDLKIVAWDSVPCDNCEGEKHIDVPASYKYWPCACKGENPACGACYGTGHHPLPDKTVKVVCPTCAGSGKIWKERFDLTPLKRHY
jgi:DnaJ-class molecular chaperone